MNPTVTLLQCELNLKLRTIKKGNLEAAGIRRLDEHKVKTQKKGGNCNSLSIPNILHEFFRLVLLTCETSLPRVCKIEKFLNLLAFVKR